MNRQKRMPLAEALSEYKNKKDISFHIPGHCDGQGVSDTFLRLVGEDVLRCDATEVKGLDDYHKAESVIAEAQQLAAELWGSDETLFLINGTTSGIMASICALTKKDDMILIQRNSHLAVSRGLTLSGARPVYFSPYISEKNGIPGSISPEIIEQMLSENDRIKAVYLTDPTYYGVTSNLPVIISAVHERGIPVIVDEAHGGHLYFCKGAAARAISAGADIVIQSTHKTVGSMTQSSMIHLTGSLIDKRRVSEMVKMFQSTSPSYILMASLDAARYNMALNGKKIFAERIEWCNSFRRGIKELPGIKCAFDDLTEDGCVFDFDRLRLVVSAEECGLSGIELSEILKSEYGIVPEFADEKYIAAVTGPGTPQSSIIELYEAFHDISLKRAGYINENNSTGSKKVRDDKGNGVHPRLPDVVYTPAEADNMKSREIIWDNCAGHVSAIEVTPYPPGIPMLLKGELITDEMRDYIKMLADRGIRVHGLEKRRGEWHSYILDTAR